MVYVWQAADFLTGRTSPDRVLPHVSGSGNYTHDIKANQTSSVKVHKDLLGPNGAWRRLLKRVDTMVICHDDDKAWNDPDAILTGGFVNSIPATYGSTVEVNIAGLNEWWRLHAVCSVYDGQILDPNATYLFQGSTWQNTIHSIIMEAHSTAGIPTGKATPPQTLRNVSGITTTVPTLISKEQDQEFPDCTVEVQPANYKTYFDVLTDIRENLSASGNEFMPKLYWADSSKTLVTYDIAITPDSQPYLNFDQSKTIRFERDGDLSGYVDGSKDYHVLNVELNQNGGDYANRIIAQSNAGSDEEDADFSTKTSSAGPDVLVDVFFNPNVKLAPAVLDAEMTKRLTDAGRYQVNGTVTILGDPAVWNNNVGKKLTLIDTTDDDSDRMLGFGANEELRISDIKVTLSESSNDAKIVVGFMTPATRYHRLPREYRPEDPLNSNPNGNNPSKSPVVVGRPANDPNFNFNGSGGSTDTTPTGPGTGVGTSWGGTGVDATDISRVACGYRHSLAIDSTGQIRAWGNNESGQLGYGNKADDPNKQTFSSSPYEIVNKDKDWKSVYAYNNTSFAIKKDNTLWAWGENPLGAKTYPTDDRHLAQNGTPVKVADNVKIFYIAYSGNKGYIIKNDGTLWAAGNNGMTQGNGDWLGFSDGFSREEFMQIGTKTDWVKFETNENCSYHLMLDGAGKLWTWGSYWSQSEPTLINNPEILGVTFKDIAVHTTTSLGTKNYGAGAIATTGELYVWGTGVFADTDTETYYRQFPLIRQSDSLGPCHSFVYRDPTQLRPMDTHMVITSEGKLKLFGNGHSWGISGFNSVPFDYGAFMDFDWKQAYYSRSNQSHIMFIIRGGEQWAGGWNYAGQLGRGNTSIVKPTPYQLGPTRAWKRINMCQETAYGFSLGVFREAMYGTGRNNLGQLGLGKDQDWFAPAEDVQDRVTWTIQPSSKQ